ncbi:hypothetical protein SK128_028649 [Halocaridina rubra]|uniref:Peptidase M14 domain-containing protein n=1 Tax=Halocaridina rubra TaxID=373956 RepID=A0AAN8ZZD1_HALRR
MSEQLWEILESKDFYHGNYLEILGFASQLDENLIRIHQDRLDEAKDYMRVFQIPYIQTIEDDSSEPEESLPSEPEDFERGVRYRRDVIHAIPSIECRLDYCPEPKVYDWMSYDEITSFVLTINSSFVSRVLTTSIGKTSEGRDIWQVRIRRGPCDEDKNFYLAAGSVGREWIAPAVAVNFIWRLIYECLMAPGYSFYIVPLLNPDGYEYSRNNVSNWIKNRVNTTNENCTGANIDRNYSYKFGEAGSSLEPCSDVYNGGVPFSQAENRAIDKGVAELHNVTMLMSFSSAFENGGESILYPWSWSQLETPDSKITLQEYANVFSQAAADAHDLKFTVKQASFSPSSHSGTITDWALGIKNATSAFTVRLRGNSTSNYQDKSIILKAVEEAWAGFDALISRITSDNDEGED